MQQGGQGCVWDETQPLHGIAKFVRSYTTSGWRAERTPHAPFGAGVVVRPCPFMATTSSSWVARSRGCHGSLGPTVADVESLVVGPRNSDAKELLVLSRKLLVGKSSIDYHVGKKDTETKMPRVTEGDGDRTLAECRHDRHARECQVEARDVWAGGEPTAERRHDRCVRDCGIEGGVSSQETTGGSSSEAQIRGSRPAGLRVCGEIIRKNDDEPRAAILGQDQQVAKDMLGHGFSRTVQKLEFVAMLVGGMA